MKRTDLKPFDMECLEEIREKRRKMNGGGQDRQFFEELELILKDKQLNHEWSLMPKDEKVLGEVWSQPIGNRIYERNVHKFEYIYTPTQGLVIDRHGHTQKVNKGKQQDMKIKEWYIFPDGTIKMCRKDKEHVLINNYGEPIYVISVKVMGANPH